MPVPLYHVIVAAEALHVKGLIQNRKLALSFSDGALGKLLCLLESKVAHRGGQLVKVDRFFPSSQLCHQCGWRWYDIQSAGVDGRALWFL